MTPIDTLKQTFREGRRDEAIAGGEAALRAHPDDLELARLCATMHAVAGDRARAIELLRVLRRARPADADALFNLATCERDAGDLDGATRDFAEYTLAFPKDPAGWASLAECRHRAGAHDEGLRAADRAIQLDPKCAPAYTARGHCLRGLGRHEQALDSYRRANRLVPNVECWHHSGLALAALGRTAEAVDCLGQALRLQPGLAPTHAARADALRRLGRVDEAIADYVEALRLAPRDEASLREATTLLLQTGQGARALALCRDLARDDPGHLAARLGAEWTLGQLVPLWHVPMMNERERNEAYRDGLAAVVGPDLEVFEIGTGSGLLAMIAARLGARAVRTCEAVPLIADTARAIVARNGLQDRVTVLSKPSHAVRVGEDLPEKADVLVHEIFSSELLGEAVLPAIEDAKARLLKPGGAVMPRAASIVVALVGGEALGRHLHVDRVLDFDLGPFNAIYPKKVPLQREDLAPRLLSDDVEAFRFDFAGASRFPAERRTLRLVATGDGTCHGVVQWLRVDLAPGVAYENHPSRPRAVANWQPTVFAFDAPLRLARGDTVTIEAAHDRSRPWFARVEGGAA